MIGVNIDNIDALIKKNNYYLDSFNDNKIKLLDSINNLNKCYDGTDLEYLFDRPIRERDNIEKIYKVMSNYSSVLTNVKRGYQFQDESLKSQMNRISQI